LKSTQVDVVEFGLRVSWSCRQAGSERGLVHGRNDLLLVTSNDYIHSLTQRPPSISSPVYSPPVSAVIRPKCA